MLKHVVLLKFKESVTEEQIADLKKSLLALPKKIKEIKGYECGSDRRPTKAFDFGLVLTSFSSNASAGKSTGSFLFPFFSLSFLYLFLIFCYT